jgi:hypothetical protein
VSLCLSGPGLGLGHGLQCPGLDIGLDGPILGLRILSLTTTTPF